MRRRSRAPPLLLAGSEETRRQAAAAFLVAHLRILLMRKRRPAAAAVASPTVTAAMSFGGPAINGKHDGAQLEQRGAEYWRRRTDLAVMDARAVSGSWSAMLRSVPPWAQ